MPLDLEKLRRYLNDSLKYHAEGLETMTVQGLDELLRLAERAQRYETALREIADNAPHGNPLDGRTGSCAVCSAREALKR